jgi:hypothetical protein
MYSAENRRSSNDVGAIDWRASLIALITLTDDSPSLEICVPYRLRNLRRAVLTVVVLVGTIDCHCWDDFFLYYTLALPFS